MQVTACHPTRRQALSWAALAAATPLVVHEQRDVQVRQVIEPDEHFAQQRQGDFPRQPFHGAGELAAHRRVRLRFHQGRQIPAAGVRNRIRVADETNRPRPDVLARMRDGYAERLVVQPAADVQGPQRFHGGERFGFPDHFLQRRVDVRVRPVREQLARLVPPPLVGVLQQLDEFARRVRPQVERRRQGRRAAETDLVRRWIVAGLKSLPPVPERSEKKLRWIDSW